MNRRSFLTGSLTLACSDMPAQSVAMQSGSNPPGYNPYTPADCINVVCFGDSGTQGFGDIITKGGWVNRLITYINTEFGTPNRFQFRGTNPVRGFVGTAWTEGHGGLQLKPEAEWGSFAAGATVDNVDQAMYNKPISGIGTGQRMFGSSGYHQNVHLVFWALAAGNVNDYSEAPEFIAQMILDSITRLRNLLNENSADCIIAFNPSVYDWGGNTEAGAAVNHQRVLDIKATFPDIVSDFATRFPGQPLWTNGFSGYDDLGLWSTTTPFQFGWDNPTSPGQFFDIVHPNELGYDWLGDGTIAAIDPVLHTLSP